MPIAVNIRLTNRANNGIRRGLHGGKTAVFPPRILNPRRPNDPLPPNQHLIVLDNLIPLQRPFNLFHLTMDQCE